MATLFVLGSVGFWILLCVAVIFLLVSMNHEDWGGTWATVTLGVFICLFYFLGNKNIVNNIVSYISSHFGQFVLCVVGYLFIGVVWSFIKWYYFLLNKKENGVRKNSSEIQVSQNKSRIIAWMSYWPPSALWTLINDPVKRLFNNLFRKFEKVYQRIFNNVFKEPSNVLEDLVK